MGSCNKSSDKERVGLDSSSLGKKREVQITNILGSQRLSDRLDVRNVANEVEWGEKQKNNTKKIQSHWQPEYLGNDNLAIWQLDSQETEYFKKVQPTQSDVTEKSSKMSEYPMIFKPYLLLTLETAPLKKCGALKAGYSSEDKKH